MSSISENEIFFHVWCKHNKKRRPPADERLLFLILYILFLSHRNPDFAIVLVILCTIRILGRVIIHLHTISGSELVLLKGRKPF